MLAAFQASCWEAAPRGASGQWEVGSQAGSQSVISIFLGLAGPDPLLLGSSGLNPTAGAICPNSLPMVSGQ